MNIKYKNKGFTLIELLVVIAIIGVLSSIVISSVNTARNKAADAALRKSLQEIYNKVQEYAIDNNIVLISEPSGGPLNTIPGTGTPFVYPNTLEIVKKIEENSLLFYHPYYFPYVGQIKGMTARGWNYEYFYIVVKSKTGDFLCIDSTSASSNKIYKVKESLILSYTGGTISKCTNFE
jgi:prepilin-type N-terminal cleavage/methylation domain-containing protein